MADPRADWSQPATFDARHFDRLIAALRALGYTVFGPRVRDESVVIDEIESAAMLPAGWEDQQERGRYTLTRTDSPRLFGITHGAHSWKRLLHPPTVRLWRAERGAGGLQFTDGDPAPRPMALVGVRPCELKAIHVQDGVLLDPHASDAVYRARREPAFIVVVQCARAGGTCFCASMETGPRARAGFDLALTEMVGPDGHWFLAEVGTHRGAEVLMLVGSRPATTRGDHAGRALGEGCRRSHGAAPGYGGPSGAAGRALWPRALGRARGALPRPAATARWCARRASARPSRTTPISGTPRRIASVAGTRASLPSSRTSTAAACALPRTRGTASGSCTSSPPGMRSSGRAGASAAAVASPGVPSASILPRRRGGGRNPAAHAGLSGLASVPHRPMPRRRRCRYASERGAMSTTKTLEPILRSLPLFTGSSRTIWRSSPAARANVAVRCRRVHRPPGGTGRHGSGSSGRAGSRSRSTRRAAAP